MQSTENTIIIFLLSTTAIILLLGILVVMLLNTIQKSQISFQNKFKILTLDFEKNVIAIRLEVQEQTMQDISREIHDNINLSLTLAKLHLNTLNWKDNNKTMEQVNLSINLLTESIENLSDVSKSLNSDLIANYGLIKAIEKEILRISQAKAFTVKFDIEGEILFLNNQKELILFRIIQEAFNNIIKHAQAKQVILTLRYTSSSLFVTIKDDGIGFLFNDEVYLEGKSGMRNMLSRTKMLGGDMTVQTAFKEGSILKFKIPIKYGQ